MKIQLYDKSKIEWDHLTFSNMDLRRLIIPLMIEQFLNSLMGMADTMMVSRAGEAAISAVSLVDAVNILITQVFTALATGGTIICAQYIGRQDKKESIRAARQVVWTVFVISMAISIICVAFRRPLLALIFGKVEKAVMTNSITYMWITACSFPFIALFQAGAAFFQASGDSRFPMTVSVLSNIINIVGNAILIFGFHMGVAGAAYSTLVSRIFCMAVVFARLRQPRQMIVINDLLKIRPEGTLIKKILAIGIPSGIENGMFQFGKLAIQSSVSTLGTVAIAAQAMASTLENLNGIAAIGIGIGMMTIVGQCLGARKKEEAKYYIVKLSIISEFVIIASCLLVLALTKPVLFFGKMSVAGTQMCWEMMCAITIVKPLVWVFAFVPPYGMRAAGDVKYSMILSMIVMWGCRVALATFLIRGCEMGPMAVWIGMFADWTIRGFLYSRRYLSGKWMQHKVID